MQWKDSMATGVELVDIENKKLVETLDGITRILYATKKCDEKTAEKIRNCFKDNFKIQEAFMEKYQYEEFFQHQYQHRRCMQDLERRIDELYADETGGGVNGLNTFLMQWIIKHFGIYDKTFSEFVNIHQNKERVREIRSKSALKRKKNQGKTIREMRGIDDIKENEQEPLYKPKY